MNLNYFGMLRSPASWAKIGRELVSAFMKQGDGVNVFERRGFLYDSRYPLPDTLEISNNFIYDKTLTFEYPGNYKYITSKQKFGMLVYETTKAPAEWAGKVNESLDLLFLPNEFNKKMFVEAGVKPEMIRVVPHGINPDVFNNAGYRVSGFGFREDEPRTPNPESRNRFTFLTVAMPQRRKGLDVLIPAFKDAFEGKKEIELLMKFPYAPGKSKYDIEMPKLPKNVRIITAEYTEEQMADLYRSADCFVLPSRAEGFGIVYLEALACGLPVIATGWGGHMEFLNEKNSLLLQFKTAPAAGIQYDNDASGGLMAEPSYDDLVYKLRHMFAYYDKEAQKAEAVDLSRFYWGNIAGQMREEMQGLGTRG